MDGSCFICRKHAGEVAPPPGGYVYADGEWKVCHAPPNMAGLGTFVIEARRHVLDFADMVPAETASYGPLLQRLYANLKSLTDAERIYTFISLEGTPHFHTWLVPRRRDEQARSVALLARDDTCDEADAAALAAQLRTMLLAP